MHGKLFEVRGATIVSAIGQSMKVARCCRQWGEWWGISPSSPTRVSGEHCEFLSREPRPKTNLAYFKRYRTSPVETQSSIYFGKI